MEGGVVEQLLGQLAADIGPNEVEVYCWRIEQLERAGYSSIVAHLIAESPEIDLHEACSLIQRGCPEQTAFDILA